MVNKPQNYHFHSLLYTGFSNTGIFDIWVVRKQYLIVGIFCSSLFLNEVQLIYSVISVSDKQHSDSIVLQIMFVLFRASQVVLVVKNPPVNAGWTLTDASSIPGSGRTPGGGHGNLLQYPYLENPMDRGAWQFAVLQGHTESDMTLVTQYVSLKL